LMAYHLILKPPAITQQQEKNDIESDTINVTGSFITYDDTCPDDGEDYGPEGSVIWGPRTIEENIYINGKWYINENSEEWEENEGC
ncbi:hypothetical protein, partial [Phascolarctobacterium succinatutens]